MAAKNNIVIHEGESREIIIYRDSDNTPKVEVLLQHENLWLTQKSLSTLFGVERSVVTKHIKNIFETGELQENSVCANFAHTASDGKSYNTMFYNLDLVIAIGYRVNLDRTILTKPWNVSAIFAAANAVFIRKLPTFMPIAAPIIR